jgi:hypothetical protein
MADAKADGTQDLSHYERAQVAFDDASEASGATVRMTESRVECPQCETPNSNMVKRSYYVEPEQYHVTLECDVDDSHDDERYGYYSTEGTE